MPDALTTQLCTQCGLCCDGTLLADIETYGDKDAQLAEDLGLRVDYEHDEAAVIQQPCSVIDGTRCGVFPHRPIACGSFECGLLVSVRADEISADQALEIIREVRGLAEGIKNILSGADGDDASLPLRERVQEAAHTDAFALISEPSEKLQGIIDRYFLGERRKEHGAGSKGKSDQ